MFLYIYLQLFNWVILQKCYTLSPPTLLIYHSKRPTWSIYKKFTAYLFSYLKFHTSTGGVLSLLVYGRCPGGVSLSKIGLLPYTCSVWTSLVYFVLEGFLTIKQSLSFSKQYLAHLLIIIGQYMLLIHTLGLIHFI